MYRRVLLVTSIYTYFASANGPTFCGMGELRRYTSFAAFAAFLSLQQLHTLECQEVQWIWHLEELLQQIQ